MTIAGHTFAITAAGCRCTAYSSAKNEVCGVAWLHVRSCTQEDVGRTLGFSHSSYVIPQLEYNEIRVEAQKEEDTLWAAVIDAASAGSR